MDKCVIYLHGWQGSPESRTKKALEEALVGVRVLAPSIDHNADPTETDEILRSELVQMIRGYDLKDVVIVGNSAGGFWANRLSRILGTNVVLINPSLDLGKNLEKYGVDAEILASYSKLKPVSSKFKKNAVLISENDEVVDNPDIALYFANITYMPNEGHRLVDHTPVINTVKEMLDVEVQDVPI